MSVIAIDSDSGHLLGRLNRGLLALRLARKSRSYPVFGAAFSVAMAMGLPIARAVATGQLPTAGWVFTDVASAPVTYGYVTLSSLFVAMLFGHMLGRWCDREHLLSITDPLTGVFNRRHFAERLAREVRRARRDGQPTSVLCLDLDHLKQINDRFGHRTGDEALVALTRTLSRSVRPNDVIARSGGDEFMVLLPGTAIAEASAISGRILAAVGREDGSATGHFEVSIGIAEMGPGEDAQEMVSAADAALYGAKAAGGGRSAVAASVSIAFHNPQFTLGEAVLRSRASVLRPSHP